MSGGEPVALADARQEAERIQRALVASALFDRVQIAGSVRRERAWVRDLEIVARVSDAQAFDLERAIDSALRGAGISRFPKPIPPDRAKPWGLRYRKGIVGALTRPGLLSDPFCLDLFIVRPPARWGPVLAIRTGSAAFSQYVVTRLHTFGLACEDGRVVRRTAAGILEVPVSDADTEDEFFAVARLRPPPPPARDVPLDRAYLLDPA